MGCPGTWLGSGAGGAGTDGLCEGSWCSGASEGAAMLLWQETPPRGAGGLWGPAPAELRQRVGGLVPGIPSSAPAVALLCTGLALDTLQIAPECSDQPVFTISLSAGVMCRCLWENPPFSAGTVSQCGHGAKLCSSWGILE